MRCDEWYWCGDQPTCTRGTGVGIGLGARAVLMRRMGVPGRWVWREGGEQGGEGREEGGSGLRYVYDATRTRGSVWYCERYGASGSVWY
eukprot:3941137-Rhodomonas_salina.3